MKKESSKRLLSRDYKLAKCQIDDESDLSVHFLKFERDTSYTKTKLSRRETFISFERRDRGRVNLETLKRKREHE